MSLTVAGMLLGPEAQAADSSPGLPQQAIDTLAQTSTVYVKGTERGVLQLPYNDGSAVVTDPIESEYSCTGFITSSTGNVATAGHCADATDEDRGFVLGALGHLVKTGQITMDQALAWKDSASAFNLSGKPGVDVASLSVFLPSNSQSGKVEVPATVVEDLPRSRGDVALLKIQAPGPLPALQIALNEPVNGDGVTACGFPGSVADLTTTTQGDPNQTPSLKTGHVSAIQSENSIPFIQTDAAMSEGMSGGPVVDDHGEVIGVVSHGAVDEKQPFNFASDLSTLQALLARHGATTAPTAGDQAFRDGLDAFYSADYHSAVSDFDTVLAEQPDNTTAQSLRAKALSIDPNAGSLLGVAPVLLWGTTLAVVVMLALGAWWFLRRRRFLHLRPETFTVPDPRTSPPHTSTSTPPNSAANHDKASNPSNASKQSSAPGPGDSASSPTATKSRVTEPDPDDWWTEEESVRPASAQDEWWA